MAQVLKAQAPGPRKTGGIPTYAPNQTLYISNIPTSKIQKPDLRIALYALFSTYGPVLDVVALRTTKMRGQAHIVFRDIQAATQAMRALQGFDFFGKEMQISYAKTKSDTIAKLDGSYRMPSAAAAVVETTDLQKAVFGTLPSSAAIASLPPIPPAPASLKVPQHVDHAMEDAKSPTTSVAGQKRRREDEDDEPEEDSEGDVAMDEDSDDE